MRRLAAQNPGGRARSSGATVATGFVDSCRDGRETRARAEMPTAHGLDGLKNVRSRGDEAGRGRGCSRRGSPRGRARPRTFSVSDAGYTIAEFRGVEKTFDGHSNVVDNLNLNIIRGEFLTLLGPSGSGKTTTLMMLAGFETPTAGEILLNGRSLNNVPPYARDMGIVFQNYALFPHMSVAENLAFPLDQRRV